MPLPMRTRLDSINNAIAARRRRGKAGGHAGNAGRERHIVLGVRPRLQDPLHIRRLDGRPRAPLRPLRRCAPPPHWQQEGRSGAPDIAHSGFGIVDDDPCAAIHRTIASLSSLRPFAINCRFQEVKAPGDRQLLLFGVTRQFDDFHAVPQRCRKGVEYVRRGDEHDFR